MLPSSMKYRTQKQLIKEASKKSVEIFGNSDDSPYTPKSNNYAYFPGMYYFNKGTITPDMIERLQDGATMLSVGSGDGHLERLLCQGFQIPKKQISVSDVKLDPEIIPSGFPSYEFDMTKPWPKFEQDFDYILFPESLGVAMIKLKLNQKGDSTYRFYPHIDNDAERIIQGEMPLNPEFFQEVIEQDLPEASKKYEIIKEAITRLNPYGEVRIKFGIDSNQQKAYVMQRLRNEYSDILFPPPNQNSNFTIKLP